MLIMYLLVTLSGTKLQGCITFKRGIFNCGPKRTYLQCSTTTDAGVIATPNILPSVNLPPSMKVSGWAPNICRVIDLFVGHLFDKEPFVSHLPGSPDLHSHYGCLRWERQSWEGPHLTIDVKLFFLTRQVSRRWPLNSIQASAKKT